MMRILFSIVLLLMTSVFSAQQLSLYDRDGEARAYIDYNEDATIFMWNGQPVAFVEKDGRDLCVFGFNGLFLGWYKGGVIYDKQGYVVGANKEVLNTIVKIEGIKGIQKITPIRPITPITPIQPILMNSWGRNSLIGFLYEGKK